jgi:CO/xanthine dehydrogenase Mo-binding subunit
VSDRVAVVHLVGSQVDRGTASVDAELARSMPGVLHVFTPADLPQQLAGGAVLAEQVRYQGEPVAAVVAESEYAAADAAETVDVVVDRQTVADDVLAGVDTPSLVHVENGDALTCIIEQPRWHIAPLQTNGCLVEPAGGGAVVVRAAIRDAPSFATALAKALGADPGLVRVEPTAEMGRSLIAGDVVAPGHVVATAAARKLDRPVRWQESRAESLTSGGEHAGFDLIAKLDGIGPEAVLRIRLTVDVGVAALPASLDDRALRDLPWYGFSAVHMDLQERHSHLPPAHVDMAAVLARVAGAEAALSLSSRLAGEPLALSQSRLAEAWGPEAVALLESARSTVPESAGSGIALAPGLAAAITVELDRATGEWAPAVVSLSVCGDVTERNMHALRAGAVDGYGLASMQQIPFDDQGTCLAATLMDYVMPSSAEVPSVSIQRVDGASAKTLTSDLARALATAAVAAAARNALVSLLPAIDATATPLRPSDAWEAAWA